VSGGRDRLFDGHARTALVVAVLTMALGGAGFRAAVGWLEVALRKEPVELQRHLRMIPRSLGPWRALDDIALDAASIEELGTPNYLNRAYVCEDGEHEGETVMVHVAYFTGLINAVPHIPDRCFVAAGWEPATQMSDRRLAVRFPEARDDTTASLDGEPYRMVAVRDPVDGRIETVRLPFGEPELRMAAFSRTDQVDQVLYGGYLFIANHRLTPSPESVRALAFRLSERHAYFAKVQFQWADDSNDDPDRFLAMTSDLLQRLLPHLMRCLPDWAEVESGSGARTIAPVTP
jgi:hypothetical protein